MRHITYKGLSSEQVAESRRLHGSNVLTPVDRMPLWKQFLLKFKDPLIIILLVAGVLSIGISVYEYMALPQKGFAVFFEPIGIIMAILLATGLAFFFEHRADNEFRILNRSNDDEPVEVIRSGNTTRVPMRDIVVGDIVVLNTGDNVPADGRLLDAVTLSVDESSLTGEPICHKTVDAAHMDAQATYASDLVLRGSKVIEGHGLMEVQRVGDATEMGKVFTDAQIDNSVKTPLNEQIDRLGRLISNASYTIAAAIIVGRLLHFFGWALASFAIIPPVAIFFYLVVNRFGKWSKKTCLTTLVVFFAVFIGLVMALNAALMPGDDIAELLAFTLETIMVAVTLIVVAVPEGLPMAVTLALAFSMRRMFQTNNLVRKLHACETMGATTTICTDKTGTLTANRMTVAEVVMPALKGGTLDQSDEARLIAEAIAVNSTASLDLSGDKPTVIGNPTEGALLQWLMASGVDYRAIRDSENRVAELPFTTERKYMATIVRSAVTGGMMLYVKGAPEIVMDMCSHVDDADRLTEALHDYQSRGMRTLGFACKSLDSADGVIDNGVVTATDLTFMGIVAIADPVREDVPAAVAQCRNAGIDVKIVTGDTPSTAREIGRRIGIVDDTCTDDAFITGPEFAELSDDTLLKRVQRLRIISRARPADKRRLVDALQRCGEVVAVTGDGTNDAPALKQAHVGLSMGDGTSVAKEASDITIIDNSFTSIGRAVMWGRSLYRNIQRFILFQLTVNVAACLLVLSGALLGTESPLTVTQMLWVNLIMDTFGAMALASLPPTETVMRDKPRRRTDSILTRSMEANVFGVGIFFYLLTLGMLMVFRHADVTSMTDFLHLHLSSQTSEITPYELTLLFSTFVWTHFWYMFNARAYCSGGSGLDLRGCNGFLAIVAVIVVGQILIVEVLYEFFNVVPMRFTDWVIIVVGSSLVMWVREARRLLIRRKKC